MRAFDRDGRADDALAAFDRLAERLDEIGLVPGSELRRQYASIKRNRVPAPSQLPAPAAGFIGRGGELAALDRLLADGTPVVTVTGSAGVGKTALAVGWAHRIRDRFPDGQLYVDLRGYAVVSPVPPLHALSAFLRALGVPPDGVPIDLAAAVALYRQRLAGRRVLVVLDNAAGAAQIAPLLPDGDGSLALVTSRDRLADRDGLGLDVLPADDARDLLARMLGAGRGAAEPDALAEIARLCARLPLALRIAGATVGTDERLADYAARLAAGDRLTALAVEGDRQAAVRAAFELSYGALPQPARRMFRLLGCHPGPDLTAAAAASLAAVDRAEAERLLTGLATAHLVSEHTPGRYAFHDLLRAYATELAQDDPDADAARRRVLDHYLWTADAGSKHGDQVDAGHSLPAAVPGVTAEEINRHQDAMAWYTAEHPVLLAVFDQAVAARLDVHVWHLADEIWEFLAQRGHWLDWERIERAALAAAARSARRGAEANSRLRLGMVRGQVGDADGAVVQFQHALDLYTELGDLRGQGMVAYNRAWLASETEDHAAICAHSRRAYELFSAADEPVRAIWALSTAARGLAGLGHFEAAIATCHEALPKLTEAGLRAAEGAAYTTLATAYHGLGRYTEAVSYAERAVAIHRDDRDRALEGDALDQLGRIHRDRGDGKAAERSWRAAIVILDDLGHRDADTVRAQLQQLDAAPSP
jgi:tetratricopeptide (TPR) repeat protein